MKIREIIKEAEDSNTAGKGGKQKKPRTSSKVHDHYQAAIKGMETYPNDTSYYTMYRFGIDMARGTQEHHPYDSASPVGNQMTTVAYTDAEQKIINNSKKNIGLTSKTLTSKDSNERNDTHTKSPVAVIKKNKYGV